MVSVPWHNGECVNKPKFAASIGAASSMTACESLCFAKKQSGCCYWKPKDKLCKFFAGALGDNAGAGGRYQEIIAC